MDNNARTNVILIVLGIIVLAGAAYMLFAKGDTTSVITQTGTPGTEAESAFLALTAEIGSIRFDTTIFTDPRFAVLRDIRTAIVPEAAGRPDPFAPLQGLPSGTP